MLLTAIQLAEFRALRAALVADAVECAHDAWLDPTHIDRFVAENPAGLSSASLERVGLWRDAVAGPFFVMRHTDSCSIFMNAVGTFAVRGTDVELGKLVPKTPTLVETTLLPFEGLIVCATEPRFDVAELGEASHADIDATYRSLADKGVIYSATALARALRRDERPRLATRPATGPVAAPGVLTSNEAIPCEGAPVIEEEVVPETLAPVAMLRPAPRRQDAPSVPAGLAQIIAFKPRTPANVAYS